MVVMLTVLFGVFMGFLLVFALCKRRHSSVNKLPGPQPNFFIGNLIDFMGSTDKFLSTLHLYFETYGPIIKVHDGPINTIVAVTDGKFLEHILSSTKLITKSTQYSLFHSWLGTGLLTSTGAKWKVRRRLLTPAFHFSILENFIDIFDSVGDVFIKKLNEYVDNGDFNIYPLVSLCTLDIMCESAMGISINAQLDGDSEYVRSVKAMCAIITDRNFSPIDPVLYPLTINYFKERSLIKILHAHTNKVIEERLKDFEAKKFKKADKDIGIKEKLAFMDLLIQSTVDGNALSKEDIREEVDTFMFEGHDTTSSAISFILYSLANNQDIQKKVLEEQTQIFGNITNPRVTMADLQNMKYLELVIKESLRLYPSVPFFARTVTEDFEYDGVLYPRGLNILLFIFGSHRNPLHFPNPDKFIPERFINADGTHPYAYIPFSAGPRNCIGQKFAMLEIKNTVSKVVRNFELHPAETKKELKLAPEIILISKSGIWVTLQKRSRIE